MPAGRFLLHFHHSDIPQSVIRLTHNDIRNDSHIRLLEASLRRGHGHGDSVAGHVRHAVGVALGNNQAFDLCLAQSGLNNVVQTGRRFQLLAAGGGVRVGCRDSRTAAK